MALRSIIVLLKKTKRFARTINSVTNKRNMKRNKVTGLLRIFTDIFIIAVTLHRFEPMSLTFKPSKRAYGINSYALLAQWLNGMSLAVNSYLIPIQLCGGKKTKWHRCNYIYAISVFLPRFNEDSRYCYYRIRQILCNPEIDSFLRSVDSKKKIRVVQNSLISEFWTTLIVFLIFRVQSR